MHAIYYVYKQSTTKSESKGQETRSTTRHLRHSRSSGASSIGRFYLRRRSGTLRPCLLSPSCFGEPRFPYDRYPPSPFPLMPPVTDLRSTLFNFASLSSKHEWLERRKIMNLTINAEKQKAEARRENNDEIKRAVVASLSCPPGGTATGRREIRQCNVMPTCQRTGLDRSFYPSTTSTPSVRADSSSKRAMTSSVVTKQLHRDTTL